MACYGSGPAEEPDHSCPWLSPTIKLDAAISKPLRFEYCIETTNITTGANWQVTAYATRLDTGSTSSHATPLVASYVPSIFDNVIGANLDHTGGGTSWSGYFMFAVWNNVNNHRIGAACEIEGGC
jgi:hypothetical protein